MTEIKQQPSPVYDMYELFVAAVEKGYFCETLAYRDIAASIKTFGYAGVTELNNYHFEEIFEGYPGTKSYLSLLGDVESRSVSILLKTMSLMCKHESLVHQIKAYWHIVNPEFNEQISKECFVSFANFQTKLAADTAYKLIDQWQPRDNFASLTKEYA